MKFLIFLIVFADFLASSLALKNEICGLPHSRSGPIHCVAYTPKWTYDPSSNKCIDFLYRGCGGNANRFPTKEFCENKCLE